MDADVCVCVVCVLPPLVFHMLDRLSFFTQQAEKPALVLGLFQDFASLRGQINPRKLFFHILILIYRPVCLPKGPCVCVCERCLNKSPVVPNRDCPVICFPLKCSSFSFG